MNDKELEKYADIIQQIDIEISHERAAKCGYDLINGLIQNNSEERYAAWVNYIKDVKNGNPTNEEERGGCWVPAISLQLK